MSHLNSLGCAKKVKEAYLLKAPLIFHRENRLRLLELFARLIRLELLAITCNNVLKRVWEKSMLGKASEVVIAFAVLVAGVFIASDALAFGGCVVSPENPSLILGLVGATAAALPFIRAYYKSRKKNSAPEL